MTNRLNKKQTKELSKYFCVKNDRLKGVSSFHLLDIYRGACLKAFTKQHPNGVLIWVAFPMDWQDQESPIEVDIVRARRSKPKSSHILSLEIEEIDINRPPSIIAI